MNERVKFVAAMLEAEESFGELCERFGISRKQGYKWRERYEAGGVQGLVDRSRAPHSHPHAVSPDVMQLLVAARKKHPRWGPRKLLVIVKRQHPRVELPAASTVGAILKKQGLIGRMRRVRRSDPYKDRLGPYDAPNGVWCRLQGQLRRRWRALQPADHQRRFQPLFADMQITADDDLCAGDALV